MTVLKRHRRRREGFGLGFAVALLMLTAGAGLAAQTPAPSTAKKSAPATATTANKAATTEIDAAPMPMNKPEKGQELFASPRRAAKALEDALKEDRKTELLKILGPGSKDVLWSGDAAEDRSSMERFVKKYDEMHRLQTEPDGYTRLYVGAENWPYPIPLARAGLTWFFDTTAGREEILARRVGRNELTIIDVCGEMVEAQKEYFSKVHEGEPKGAYAQRILSRAGKEDGLYWPASGDAESPLGPFIAKAEAEGYTADATQKPEPFHGYFFRVLHSQGANAPGGAKDYVRGGRMTGGFGILAYPAEYRSSGVMTFMVGADGVVYQKDLGAKTAELVQSIRAYNPDASWQRAD
ncbi:MAG: DUF2950 domain-containing protein [Terracidiphilus sp.]